MNNIILVKNQIMSSLEIAELTGKRHDHVMRDITNMLNDLNLGNPMFGGTYTDKANRTKPCFNLNEELSLTLVSGYSIKMRNAIIKRWKELESLNQKTELEMLLITVQKAVEHERDIKELQHQQKETTAQVKALVEGENYFTVVGYANVIDKKVDATTASSIGKKCTKLCKAEDWSIGSTKHPIYGRCNTYPKEALEHVFMDKALAGGE